MVRLREIPRTAAFAWSPGADKPLLVTGTRAGAVDADFSDETKLELWDLNLDSQDQGLELQPIASITTDSRYGMASIGTMSFGPELTSPLLGSTISPGACPTTTTLVESSPVPSRMARSTYGMQRSWPLGLPML